MAVVSLIYIMAVIIYYFMGGIRQAGFVYSISVRRYHPPRERDGNRTFFYYPLMAPIIRPEMKYL